jgi:branched-chain amino acid transport system ATP-binding protein
MTEPPALECQTLDAGYGSVTVVREIDLRLTRGTVLTVLGPNGAGKTTLLLTIAGLIPRRRGQILVDGEPMPDARPAAARRAGLVLVPDDRALFTTLTVEENLRAARPRRTGSHDDVIDLFPALRSRWKVRAADLSGGEQQMLAMARGLIQRPRVLLIDEMSMGLAPVIVEQLLPVVRTVADETSAVVILVEQHAQLALAIADEAMVIAHGTVAMSGRAADIADDAVGLEGAYLGSPAAEPPVSR